MPADGSVPLTSVRMYLRTSIHTWKKNPRSGDVDVTDILATLTPGRGITEPLRLRKERDGSFTALKGNRRLMAAAIRGLEELPGIEVTWSDEEALEEALVDEARCALTPLEEAAALVRLRDRGLDVDAIAARAGRTARHVRQRFALHDALGPEGKELLAGWRISLALAVQLSTLSAAAQKEAAADIRRRGSDGEPMAFREVSHVIDRSRLRLVDGGFPLDDAALVPAAGACTSCPKRTGVQAELFADGIEDTDLCTDKACFEEKRKARAEQVRAQAKASGLRFVDAKAEVKKIFPYGSSLPYDSPFVDLDQWCQLVRPPREAMPKNEHRHGGAPDCSGEESGGEHDFDGGDYFDAADYEETPPSEHDEPGCREALAAGCAAWTTCTHGCGAWQEIDASLGAEPRGWKPPTWREALEKAQGSAPKPSLLAEDALGVVHELADKKEAMKALKVAGMVDKRDVEIRETPIKKPGELDRYQLDNKAKHEAKLIALEQVAAKASKKTPDVKFWRFLAGLVLAFDVVADGDEIEGAWKRRQPVEESKPAPKGKTKPKDDDPVEQLRAWATKADEAELRGLVVELLAVDGYHGDTPFAIACRFFGIDIAELSKAAATRIKAELKAKEKEKLAKAKKKAAGAPTKAVRKGEVMAPAKAVAKPEPKCPLTFKHVLELAKLFDITPREGPCSPANVWGAARKVLDEIEQAHPAPVSRVAIVGSFGDYGEDALDLALALVEKGGAIVRKRTPAKKGWLFSLAPFEGTRSGPTPLPDPAVLFAPPT